jgi:hypothetical protein
VVYQRTYMSDDYLLFLAELERRILFVLPQLPFIILFSEGCLSYAGSHGY